MSDIAERLRQRMCWLCGGDCSSAAGEPTYCPKLEDNEAADEIERLKNAIEDLTADLKDDESEIGRLRAEVEATKPYERLWRNFVSLQNGDATQLCKAAEDAERLRAEVADQMRRADGWSDAYGNLREERDRLRELLLLADNWVPIDSALSSRIADALKEQKK